MKNKCNVHLLKLCSVLFVLGGTTNSVIAQDWNEIIKTVASDRESGDEFGYSVAISGNYAIVGANKEDENAQGGNTLTDAGSAFIFQNNAGNWSQVQKIVASDRAAGDEFGFSVAISGDYAIVGARYEDEDAQGGNTISGAGSAYIFQNNAGTWSEVQKIAASDREASDEFGYSVAISGDYAVVGAWGEDGSFSGATLSDAGSAYIFQTNAGTWSEVQKIVASDRWAFDYFGSSISISGDYIIVGAWGGDTDAIGGNNIASAGSAYIFRNNSGTWSEDQKIVASDRWTSDMFGYSVAISGNYAIVGSRDEDEDEIGGNTLNDAGSAYIFQFNAGTWSEVQKIVASDREDGDEFGFSVAISGDYAIVGARHEDDDETGGNSLTRAGSAYTFKNNGGIWSEVQKIVASDRGGNDRFGSSAAISGDYAIVGAPQEDEDTTGGNTLSGAGSAYIFNYCPSTNGIDVQNACSSLAWIDGNTYTSSNNTATYTLTNSAGCDSIVTLNLTIGVSDSTTTTSGISIIANNSNATYQWLDCDNGYTIVNGETGQTFTALANGNYAVELTENGCVDTSACVGITTVGILENNLLGNLSVYPNPTSGNFTIDLGSKYQNSQILMTDIIGKIIYSETISQSQVLNLSIDKPAGMYIISVQADDKKAIIRLIKE